MGHIPPKILTGTFVSSLGRTLGTLLSIATIAVVTRALVSANGKDQGVLEYGVYASVFAFLSIVTIFADGGFYLIFTREASKESADEKKLLETVWLLRLAAIAFTVVVSLTVLFFIPYSLEVKKGVSVAILGMCFQLGSQLLMGVFQKRLKLFVPAFAEVFSRAIQFGLVLLISLFAPSVTNFIWAFVISAFVCLLINVFGASKFVPFKIWGSYDKNIARYVIKEALPMGVSLALSVIFFKVDSLMLSIMKSPEALAYYALPYKVLESLLFFPSLVGGLLLPVLSKASSKDAKNVQEPLRAASDLYLMGAIPITIILLITSSWVIFILGGKSFSPSIPVLNVLSVALGVLFLGNLYGNTIVAIGKQKLLVLVYLLLTVLNIGLNLIFIPKYSFMGAAWVTLITELFSVLFAAFILLKNKIRIIGTENTFGIMLSGLLMLALAFIPAHLVWRLTLSISGFLICLFWTRAITVNKLRNLLMAQIYDS